MNQKQKSQSTVLTMFNDSFDEFVDTIVGWFPNDADILMTKTFLSLMRKSNPKLLVKAWYTYVYTKYSTAIETGNISFFIEKDYQEDLFDNPDSDKIINAIQRLRLTIRNLPEEYLGKVILHLKLLNNLCNSYTFGLKIPEKNVIENCNVSLI